MKINKPISIEHTLQMYGKGVLFLSVDEHFHLIYDTKEVNMYKTGCGLICTFTGDNMLEEALDSILRKSEG